MIVGYFTPNLRLPPEKPHFRETDPLLVAGFWVGVSTGGKSKLNPATLCPTTSGTLFMARTVKSLFSHLGGVAPL